MLPASGRTPADERVTGGVTLVDLDGDGDLDLVASGTNGLRAFRNDGGRFADVTAAMLGRGATAPATAVLAGDYDNDGDADLAVLRPDGISLLRRQPAGFTDVTAAAGLGPVPGGPRTAAWLDVDHDGDLDLFVASSVDGAPATRLFRNNGNGRFGDITTEAGLAVATGIVAIVPTDFDNRRDIDLLLVPAAAPPLLFRNLRDGTFRDVAADVGLALDRPRRWRRSAT